LLSLRCNRTPRFNPSAHPSLTRPSFHSLHVTSLQDFSLFDAIVSASDPSARPFRPHSSLTSTVAASSTAATPTVPPIAPPPVAPPPIAPPPVAPPPVAPPPVAPPSIGAPHIVQQAEERALWWRHATIDLTSPPNLPPACPPPAPYPPPTCPPQVQQAEERALWWCHATIKLTAPPCLSPTCAPLPLFLPVSFPPACPHQVQQAEERALWWRHATIELASRILHCTALHPSAPQSALPKSSSDDVMSDLLCNDGIDSSSGGGSAAAAEAPPAPEAAGFVEGQSRSSSAGVPIPCDSIEGMNVAVSTAVLPIASIATAVSAAAALADSPEAQLLQAAREALNKALCFENE
ncbi:unnamed protein product, partial [Closterium sp. NIES-65]